jgi:hypothetical protein
MPLTLRLAAATAEFLRVTMPGQWQDRATQAARATKNPAGPDRRWQHRATIY